MTTSTKKRSPPSPSVHDANDLLFHWNDDQDLSIARTACLFFRVITIQLANAQTEESRRMILDLISISCYSSIFLKPYRISLTCNYSPRKEREEWFHSFKFLTTPPSLIKTRSIKFRINCNLRRERKRGRKKKKRTSSLKERERDGSVDHGWARTIFPLGGGKKNSGREKEIRFLPSLFLRDYDFTRWKLPSPPREEARFCRVSAILSLERELAATVSPWNHDSVPGLLGALRASYVRIREFYSRSRIERRKGEGGGIVTFGFLFNEVV